MLQKQLLAAILREKKIIVDKTVAALKAATPIDTGEAREGWKTVGGSIVNGVDHIDHLNRGSSKQAPAHFIERTIFTQEGVKPNGSIVRKK